MTFKAVGFYNDVNDAYGCTIRSV